MITQAPHNIISHDTFFNVLSFFEPKELAVIDQVSKAAHAAVSDHKTVNVFGKYAIEELKQMGFSTRRHNQYTEVPIGFFSKFIGKRLSDLVQVTIVVAIFIFSFFSGLGFTTLFSLAAMPMWGLYLTAVPLGMLFTIGAIVKGKKMEQKVSDAVFNNFHQRKAKTIRLADEIEQAIDRVKILEVRSLKFKENPKRNFSRLVDKTCIELKLNEIRERFERLKKERWKDHPIFRAFINHMNIAKPPV